MHRNSLCSCVVKVCSNGAATYIILEIIAKDNFNMIANLIQTFENLLFQTTQMNSEILYPNSSWICVIQVCLSCACSTCSACVVHEMLEYVPV